jgi:hypothetical protein
VRIERLRYGLKVLGFEPDTGQKIFFSRTSRSALAQTQQPPIQFVLEFFSEAERQGHDVDQSHPSSAVFINEWNHISTPPYVFMKGTGTTLLYLRQ